MNILNPIPKIIEKKISDIDTIFVFPTQTAANLWSDWTITNTKTTAVPMERFIAWDDFKGSSIRSTHQDKTSIPGTMRTIFAANLIQKNAKEKFLNYIITQEFSESASGFTQWISSILPSLALWKKSFENKNLEPDEEDKDYLEIYTRYKTFLDEHSLFDPAWETPPFDSKGKRFVIFFPEILMDYLEYKKILEETDDIELIHVPAPKEKPVGRFYTNSRTELRQMCLCLKKIHDEKNIKWQDMAVSVPDLETWGPYLDREMDLYEIPHVQRNGTPLTSSTSGILFQQIQSCVSENFSYNSIKNLLLNTALPWYDFNLNQRLISFGQENNCICSFETQDNCDEVNGEYDVWEHSFKNPLDSFSLDERLINLYRTLKTCLKAIVKSETFDEIRKNYFTFRTKFFDTEKFSEQSNKIISRCISELSELIDLEKDFPDCTVPSHYSFFVSTLDGKNYVPQTDEIGVHILPYKLSAPAPFKVQTILDSSQASLSIVYRQLSFLNDEKRLLLGFTQESNVSEHFITLYNLNSSEETIFTAAEKTFTGYALTSAYLAEKDLRDQQNYADDNLDCQDYYIQEKTSFLDKNSALPEKIFPLEKKGFESWKRMQSTSSKCIPSKSSIEKLNKLIDERLTENGKVKITYTRLKYFYEDSHKFLVNHVLQLGEETSAADLTPPFLIGNLNHKILELFCQNLNIKGLPLKVTEDGNLDDTYKTILFESVEQAIEKTKSSSLSKQLIITAKNSLRSTILEAVTIFSQEFNGYEIYTTEGSFTFEPEGEDYFFEGKVDCIIKDPSNGDCILIDFKTSENAIPKKNLFVNENTSIPDFQMPIYIHLLKNQKPQVLIENCSFFCINKAKSYPVIGELVKGNDPKEFEATFDTFLKLAKFYAKKVLEHNIDSVNPAEEWDAIEPEESYED